jgi:hypothetical protein
MKILGLILVLGIASSVARGQNNAAVSQSETVRQQSQVEQTRSGLAPGQNVPDLFDEEGADVGPQSILRKRKHRWLRLSADEQVYYTDNMLFENEDTTIFSGRPDPVEAGVSVATLEAALQTPPCVTRFASYRAEAGYRHQFFNYFGDDEELRQFGFVPRPIQLSDFDFDASTAFAQLLAQTAHYQFRVGFDYTRLIGDGQARFLKDDDYFEFYREYVPRWSVQRNFRVCDRSQFSVGYFGSYHFADEEPTTFGGGFEDRSERWEHATIVSYSVALPGDFVVQPYYRFQYTDFTSDLFEDGFSEFLHTAGLGIGWYPCANFSARLFANYNWNDSDSIFREYEQFNAGGGVNLTLRF